MIHLTLTAKVSEGTNSNIPARNMLVQLSALYTNPESHNAQRHRQTDRETDDRMIVDGPCLLDYLILELILPVVCTQLRR